MANNCTHCNLRTFDADYLAELTQTATTALKATPTFAAAATTIKPSVINHLHITDNGDTLITIASSVGGEGDVVLRGSIGPFPYEIHLNIKLNGTAVEVSLDMDKPIDLPTYTWKYNLLGVVRDVSNNIIGATDIKPDSTVAAARLGTWCILKCGGIAILGCLLKCLPSLSGGPAAYVACVTACAGSGAANIAICVAKNCM